MKLFIASLILLFSVGLVFGGHGGGGVSVDTSLSAGSAETVSGNWTFSGDVTASSITVQNQQLWGTGASISTFTPTGLTLDDGLTLTVNGSLAGVDGTFTGTLSADTFSSSGSGTLFEVTNATITISTTTGNFGVRFQDNTLQTTAALPLTGGTMTGLFAILSDAAPNASVTPTAVGQLIYNTGSNELCFSTAAAANSWVNVSDGSTACSD